MVLGIAILFFLSIVGIALVLVEIFFIPGITLAGLLGGVCLVGEIWYAYQSFGTDIGNIVLISNVVSFVLVVYFFARSRTLNKLSLHTNIEGKIPSIEVSLEGKEGKTISRLAPMGMVEIEGKTFEAKSREGFIDENQQIIVVKSTPERVEVVTKK